MRYDAVSCPACGTMLLVVGYPTLDETRAAARAGIQEALAQLERFEARRDRRGPPGT
jgi:hypothetical protein